MCWSACHPWLRGEVTQSSSLLYYLLYYGLSRVYNPTTQDQVEPPPPRCGPPCQPVTCQLHIDVVRVPSSCRWPDILCLYVRGAVLNLIVLQHSGGTKLSATIPVCPHVRDASADLCGLAATPTRRAATMLPTKLLQLFCLAEHWLLGCADRGLWGGIGSCFVVHGTTYPYSLLTHEPA